MCLFDEDFNKECNHAECQIVKTIKNLNQRSLTSSTLKSSKEFIFAEKLCQSMRHLEDENEGEGESYREEELSKPNFRRDISLHEEAN